MRSSTDLRSSFIEDDKVLIDHGQWFNRLRRAWRNFWYKNPDIIIGKEVTPEQHYQAQAEAYEKNSSPKTREHLHTALLDAEAALKAANPLGNAGSMKSYIRIANAKKDKINAIRENANKLQEKRDQYSEQFKKDEVAEKSRTFTSAFSHCFAFFKNAGSHVVRVEAQQKQASNHAPPKMTMR